MSGEKAANPSTAPEQRPEQRDLNRFPRRCRRDSPDEQEQACAERATPVDGARRHAYRLRRDAPRYTDCVLGGGGWKDRDAMAPRTIDSRQLNQRPIYVGSVSAIWRQNGSKHRVL